MLGLLLCEGKIEREATGHKHKAKRAAYLYSKIFRGGISMRCTGCGNPSLVEGELIHSDGGETKFIPSGDSKLKRALGIGSRPVRAYGCPRCGNLQLAVEFSEEDIKKYQSFEGEQQPSAVETSASE